MKDGFFIVTPVATREGTIRTRGGDSGLGERGGVGGVHGVGGGGAFLLSADHPLPRQFKKIKVELCSILSQQRMHLANLPVHVNGIK